MGACGVYTTGSYAGVAQWLERRPVTPEAAGSSPVIRAISSAAVAQLVEQRTENPWVAGSSPACGTTSPSSRFHASWCDLCHPLVRIGKRGSDSRRPPVVRFSPNLSAGLDIVEALWYHLPLPLVQKTAGPRPSSLTVVYCVELRKHTEQSY